MKQMQQFRIRPLWRGISLPRSATPKLFKVASALEQDAPLRQKLQAALARVSPGKWESNPAGNPAAPQPLVPEAVNVQPKV